MARIRRPKRTFTRGRTAPPEDDVTAAYLQVLGRDPDVEGLQSYSRQVGAGRSIEDVKCELAQSREGVLHAARRQNVWVDARNDDEFLQEIYRAVLGREADASGLAWLKELLAAGQSREQVTLLLASSEEYLNRQWAARIRIQDLRDLRPQSYTRQRTVDGSEVEVFRAERSEDLDWMENAIVAYGYYEKPGIWSMEIDDDKRRMAVLLAAFAPRRALEIGCASGAVLTCLADHGVVAQGLEISRMAIQRADPRIRPQILHADLLAADLRAGYDLIFGLDVFEHLNPNKLPAYLGRLTELVAEDGLLFVNSPSFGEDPVYGTVFPLTLPSWQDDAAAGTTFRDLLVDDDGYPSHGHLIWATSAWWTGTFARAGFHRQVELERSVHRRFDSEFEDHSLARKAFFIFSRTPER